jgi:uncharacterized protein (DUF169 family)
MDEIRLLEEVIGGRWTGIKFHRKNAPNDNLAEKPMRLCEAIKDSHRSPIVLTQNLISCPGALRSLGWMTHNEHNLARKIAEATGTKLEITQKLVADTPHLEGGASVTVGTNALPDIIVCYAQPEAAMRLVRQWQIVYGSALDVAASTVMSVCGNVVVKAYMTGRICLSFGCPDSREYGAIGRDRLVIGLPTRLITDLFGSANR